MNNVGPNPAAVLPRIKRDAQNKGGTLNAHFVAFDVAAKVFDPVKKQGATVVAAANEKSGSDATAPAASAERRNWRRLMCI